MELDVVEGICCKHYLHLRGIGFKASVRTTGYFLFTKLELNTFGGVFNGKLIKKLQLFNFRKYFIRIKQIN